MTDSIKRSNAHAPYILGVAGGSGSGKSYFATALRQLLGTENCEIIYQDNFYHDQSHRFDFDGGSVNFDHPDSLDFDFLANCLAALKQGRNTEIPLYDFKTHKRLAKRASVPPKPVIIVDGILIFHPKPVRVLFDHKIFFDTPEDLRFSRRLERDVNERGRSVEGVKAQFVGQVKPMHDQFVVPSMKYADTVVNETNSFQEILETYRLFFALR